jgi:hypothetical protein
MKYGKYRGYTYNKMCELDYQYCGWILNNREIMDNGRSPSGSMEHFKAFLIGKLQNTQYIAEGGTQTHQSEQQISYRFCPHCGSRVADQ